MTVALGEPLPTRLLALLLPLLLALACTTQPAQPTPTPPPPASPTGTAGPTVTPAISSPPAVSPTVSTPPSASPSPTPSPTPTATPTQTPTAYDAAALDAELERLLGGQRARYSIPGLSAAVLMPDGHAWSAGAGFASLEQERPASGTTPFVVGSITKTFITALVMQLLVASPSGVL